MRVFAAALLACVVTAAASAAATDYWAFGDSITRGEGAGFFLDWPPVGSKDCTTANPYPVMCGYHWRLENALTAAGIVNDVFNRGAEGEGTAVGISRIDKAGEPLETSRCTDPDAGDVLLVMEGTNDFGTLTTTAIKFNLGVMLDLATTKCVHSSVASTIRLLLAGTPINSQTGDPFNPLPTALATAISALAGEKNRAYVDVWASLCPNQACYDANYFGRLVPNDPGHVKSFGYDVMSPLFEAAILAVPLPGAATLTGPSGDVTDSTPLFSWNEHANSDWYFLEVDGGVSYGRWHPEEAICAAGVCSFDPAVALGDGGHTWRVRTRNLRGVGSWTANSPFSVWTTLPGATTPTAPTGDSCQGTAGPYAPSFQWNEATSAKDYRLQVTDVSSALVVIDQTFPSSGNCGGGSCSVVPTNALGPDAYTWKVMATNPFGNGPWSADTAFSLFPSTLGAPTPVYPLADLYDTTPTYRWDVAAGAETYDLDVDAGVTIHTADSVCNGFSCAVTGAALGVGGHTWEVTAKNRCDLTGASTGTNAFDVLTCAIPIDVDLPDPGVVNGTVDETACGELRALAGYTVGGTGMVTFHGGSAVVLGDGFEVLTGGTFTARTDY